MEQVRDFFDVAERIRRAVPARHQRLIREIEHTIDSALYHAPERRSDDWARLSDTLAWHLGTIVPERDTWQHRVVRLMRGGA